MAKKIGLSRGAIYKMINENSTKIETLEKIAETLGVPITVFFDNTKSKQKTTNSNVKRTFLAFEIDKENENKIIKMVMGSDFVKLINM